MKLSVTLGLTRVPDEDLVALLRAIHRGRLVFPLQRHELMAIGMNRLADHAAPIVGLEERAVRAVIAVVLAERRAVREASLERDAALERNNAQEQDL